MIDGIRIKVCGLTSLVDAECADNYGADFLGFVHYPASPRYVSLEQFRAMLPKLPERKKVAVMVEPGREELMNIREVGFDFFQIHFRVEHGARIAAEYISMLPSDRVWLAPKLPPETEVPAALLPLAKHFLLDTFHAEKFGGTGATGDWAKFARYRLAHPEKTWILSGGLNADNIGQALRASGARFVDVNSGVESAPGVKDHEKLKRFVVRLHEAAIAKL